LKTAVDVAKISTASVGKFQPKISKEVVSNKKTIPGLKKEKLPAKVCCIINCNCNGQIVILILMYSYKNY